MAAGKMPNSCSNLPHTSAHTPLIEESTNTVAKTSAGTGVSRGLIPHELVPREGAKHQRREEDVPADANADARGDGGEDRREDGDGARREGGVASQLVRLGPAQV
jgi:hypothetical protein